MISNEAKKEIDFWVSKYPEGRESSAVMQALTIVQKENGGSLNSELIYDVAEYLEMPAISVQEVATFYEITIISQLVSMFCVSVTISHACLMAQMNCSLIWKISLE